MNKPLATDAIAPSPAALEMIDRLIAFPTVSRDSNLGLIEFARDHLARLGAQPHLVVRRLAEEGEPVRHAGR